MANRTWWRARAATLSWLLALVAGLLVAAAYGSVRRAHHGVCPDCCRHPTISLLTAPLHREQQSTTGRPGIPVQSAIRPPVGGHGYCACNGCFAYISVPRRSWS